MRVVEVVRPDGGRAPAAGRRIEHRAGRSGRPPRRRAPRRLAARPASSAASRIAPTRWRGRRRPRWRASRRGGGASTWKSRTHCTAAPTMKRAHRPRVRPVEVEAVAPGRAVAAREVGPELRQVVPLRAEVVVDDVEADREAERVGAVDEALQRGGPAVGLVHGVGRDAVVAPVPLARERLHRHELDAGDAQLHEVREPLRGGVERARRGEGPDVQLVEDEVLPRDAGPAAVASTRWRAGSKTCDGPWTPSGWRREAGSGRTRSPSRTRA